MAMKSKLITEEERAVIFDINEKAKIAMELHGRAGTWVGLEDGKVKVRLLSEVEITEILELSSERHEMPTTISIYYADGDKVLPKTENP